MPNGMFRLRSPPLARAYLALPSPVQDLRPGPLAQLWITDMYCVLAERLGWASAFWANVLIAVYARRQLDLDDPLLDVRLFRNGPFLAAAHPG